MNASPSTKKGKSISVVIPNYNGCDLLKQNLPFLFNALKNANLSDYEVIVTDDASSDDSIQFLNDYYPIIKIVANTINKGFAGNTNKGIALATHELVFIVNTDVQVSADYFIPLLPYFDDETCFGVMGRIISIDGTQLQDTSKYPDYTFANIHSNKNYYDEDKNSCYTFFISGANALVNRKKLEHLGCFNEVFNPYYNEDVDIGLTAWRAGYTLHYDHRAICKHPNSATIKKEHADKVKLIIKRNKFILHYLHLDGFELAFYLGLSFIKTSFRFLMANKLYVKSYLLFLKSLNEIKAIKKRNEHLRLLSLRSITNFIKTDIENNHQTIKKL